MKLDIEGSTTITKGNIVTRDFTIGNVTKVIRLLSSTIYSNKILAPIRELVCNAHDAHVAAGTTDIRYLIHLPTNDESYFSIRDYGTGLTDDEVMQLYTSYGSSTKDDSNTEIGCFGLGSKAPFAYTDRFEVNAYKGGILNVYQCIFEGADIKVHRMAEIETDEPNGLEVKFDVKSNDIHSFRQEMSKLFMFQNEIKFTGYTGIQWEPLPVFTLDFAHRKNASDWCVEMGGVLYQISYDDFNQLPKLRNIRSSVGYGNNYIIHVGLGEVAMTVSRESIEWTPKSIQTVEDKAQALVNGIESQAKAAMRGKDTIWEKLTVFREFYAKYPFYKPRWYKNIIRDYFEYSDIKNKVKLVCQGSVKTSRQVNKFINTSVQSMAMFNPNGSIKWVNLGEQGKVTASIRAYSEQLDNRNDQLLCTADEEIIELLERLGAPMMTMDDFKDYEPEKKVRVYVPREKKKKEVDHSWVTSVRRYRGFDRAPESITYQWLKYQVENSTTPMCYIVQQASNTKVKGAWDTAYTVSSYQTILWKDIYNSAWPIVTTERGLKGLIKEFGQDKFVDLKAMVQDKVNNKEKIISAVLTKVSREEARRRLHDWSEYKDVCLMLVDLVPKEYKDLLVNTFTGNYTDSCDCDAVDVVLFKQSVDMEATRVARQAMTEFEGVVKSYFPLFYLAKQARNAPGNETKEDLINYVKSKKPKVKKQLKELNEKKAEENNN